MGQSHRNPPPRPPSRPAGSGGRPPRPGSVPPRSSRPRPDDEWSDEQDSPRGQPPGRSSRPPSGQRSPRPMPPLPPAEDDDADYDDAASDNSIEAPHPPRSGPASRRPPEDDGPDPLDDPRAPRSLRRTPPAPEPRRARPRDYDDYENDDADESDQRWRQPRDDRYDRRPPAGPDDSYDSAYDGSYDRGYDDDPRRRGPARPYPDERSGGRYGGDRNDRRPSGGRGQRQPYDSADVYSEWERPARGRDDRRGSYDEPYSQQYPDPRYGPRNGGGYGPRHPGWREAASQWLSAAVPVPMPGKKRKRVPVILLLVIVLAVLAVPAALFGPKVLARLTTSSTPYHGPPGTYTPGPTPKAQSGFKKYVNTGADYSMDYPQAWTVTKQDQTTGGQPDTIDIFAPATPTGASMLIEQPGDADSTPDATIISGEVAAAQQDGVTFTATSSFPVQVNIGGEFWQRQDYLVSGNGPTSHEAILAGHHEGHAYVIVLVSGADTFSQDAAAIFTPALTSFRFNS